MAGFLLLRAEGSPKQCGSGHCAVCLSSSKLVSIKEASMSYCLLCIVLIPGVNERGLLHCSIQLVCLFLPLNLEKNTVIK